MNAIAQFFSWLSGLFRWWAVIAPWEAGVRVRLGKRTKVLGPGVHLSVPVIDRIYTQSIRRRVANLQNRTVTTADGKTLVIGAQLGYEVSDVLKLYQTLHDAQGTLECQAAGLIAEYIASHALDECSPLQLARAVSAQLDYSRYGLARVDIQVDEYVVVPLTLRLVSGSGDRYVQAESLNTRSFVSGGAPSEY